LAETKSGEKIKKDVEFLRDFMLVFFFVAFGTTLFFNPITNAIQIPVLTTLLFLFAVAVAVAIGAILAHSIVTHLFGAKFGLSREDSTLVAILLVPLGEFVIIIATSAVPVLTGAESTLISPIAFLLILITVVVFQPLYNARTLHQKIFSALPNLFTLPPVRTEIKEHTPESIVYLKKFGLNIFVIICFAWSAFLIYEDLPKFGVPLLYSREITAFIGFCFFAVWPMIAALKAFKKLLEHAFRKERKVKKFASSS
jgi:hypothetical protein